MKTWTVKPSKVEVENTVKEFFTLLTTGKHEKARDIVVVELWEETLSCLWGDTVEAFEGEMLDRDNDFDGEAWEKDLSWLKKISIGNTFNWDIDEDEEREYLETNVLFRKQDIDLLAKFYVDAVDDVYHVVLEDIHYA